MLVVVTAGCCYSWTDYDRAVRVMQHVVADAATTALHCCCCCDLARRGADAAHDGASNAAETSRADDDHGDCVVFGDATDHLARLARRALRLDEPADLQRTRRHAVIIHLPPEGPQAGLPLTSSFGVEYSVE